MEKNTHSLQKHSGESMVVPGVETPPGFKVAHIAY
jgi:hypothetical protein